MSNVSNALFTVWLLPTPGSHKYAPLHPIYKNLFIYIAGTCCEGFRGTKNVRERAEGLTLKHMGIGKLIFLKLFFFSNNHKSESKKIDTLWVKYTARCLPLRWFFSYKLMAAISVGHRAPIKKMYVPVPPSAALPNLLSCPWLHNWKFFWYVFTYRVANIKFMILW